MLKPKHQERLQIRQTLAKRGCPLEPSIAALHRKINRRGLTEHLPKNFLNFR